MSKHTPGPWEVGGPFPRLTVIYCEDPGCGGLDPEPPMYGIIADLGISECPDPNDESQANARLIAAAPDLLAALHRLLLGPAHPAWAKSVEFARSVIAKAEGK